MDAIRYYHELERDTDAFIFEKLKGQPDKILLELCRMDQTAYPDGLVETRFAWQAHKVYKERHGEWPPASL